MFFNNPRSINRLIRINGHLYSNSCCLSSHALMQTKKVNVLGSNMAYIDTGEVFYFAFHKLSTSLYQLIIVLPCYTTF